MNSVLLNRVYLSAAPDNVFDVVGWINYFFEVLKNIISAVFVDVWEVFKDFGLFVFDEILKIFDWVVADLISPLMPDLSGAPSWWAGLGSDLLNLAGYVNIDTALGLVIAALTIRLILNFIPFIG